MLLRNNRKRSINIFLFQKSTVFLHFQDNFSIANEFFPLIKINKWYFEMGIIPNTHKYVFNLCVEDFEIFDEKGYDHGQNAIGKILNVFDEKHIYI